jgi:L-2-hydroxyglutarate oxidase LhgO
VASVAYRGSGEPARTRRRLSQGLSVSIDTLVVGAGVVGLAVARRLALAGQEVVVVEAESHIGSGISSRNSEVIHAGLYYPPGSLKARCCVEGREALYAFCVSHKVPHARIGKLIVATSEGELPKLYDIAERARANGVDNLVYVTSAQSRDMEPEVQSVGALWSPSTGIVDSHQLMLALLGDLEEAGGALALSSPVSKAERTGSGVRVEVGGELFSARRLVNCAGLGAPVLAAKLVGFPANLVPEQRYAKGSYFQLRGRSPFKHLIYPVPVPGGLGTHATLDLAGHCRFGPDVEWVDQIDYAVDASRADSYYAAIRRYWPGLPDGHLDPAYSGIRPKIAGAKEADFLVLGPADHGGPGEVHLFGIESPGLTAALALAERVLQTLGKS